MLLCDIPSCQISQSETAIRYDRIKIAGLFCPNEGEEQAHLPSSFAEVSSQIEVPVKIRFFSSRPSVTSISQLYDVTAAD
jgi:hypothetical protein